MTGILRPSKHNLLGHAASAPSTAMRLALACFHRLSMTGSGDRHHPPRISGSAVSHCPRRVKRSGEPNRPLGRSGSAV